MIFIFVIKKNHTNVVYVPNFFGSWPELQLRSDEQQSKSPLGPKQLTVN